MPKMRTISGAVKFIREQDPGTALTQHALRQLVLLGRVPCVAIGAKRLVDVDKLQAFLSGEAVPAPSAEKEICGIRRIV